MNKPTTNNQISVDIAVMSEKVGNIEYKIDTANRKISDVQTKLEANYATKEWCQSEYGQTKSQVNYLILTFAGAIVLAIAGFVIRGGLK